MQVENKLKDFLKFAIKVIIVHTVTYFIFGLIVSNLFGYEKIFEIAIIKSYMRPYKSPFVMAGPFLQPIRGFLYAIGIWPFRELIMKKKYGWLILWSIFIIFCIIGTAAAAPCSFEGLIYSRLPLWYHLIGIPEISLQTLAFSLWLFLWDRKAYSETTQKEMKKEKKKFRNFLESIVVGCFGYVGYAIGAIISAVLTGMVTISVGQGVDAGVQGVQMIGGTFLKTQLMFVVALIINVIVVYLIKVDPKKRILHFWQLFLVFYVLDTIVPYLYQVFFLTVPPLYFAFWLGFFPAIIMSMSVYIADIRKRKSQM